MRSNNSKVKMENIILIDGLGRGMLLPSLLAAALPLFVSTLLHLSTSAIIRFNSYILKRKERLRS